MKKDLTEEYERRHENAWPETRQTLSRNGWHNHSVFMRDDGMLFGYSQTPDSLQAALDRMEDEQVDERWWQEEMAPFFEGTGLHAE